jgi:hypothetical protein
MAKRNGKRNGKATHFKTVPVAEVLRKVGNDKAAPLLEKSTVKDDPGASNLLRPAERRTR